MEKEVKDHLGNAYKNESQMCKKYGISQSTFYQRYHINNWTLEDALTKPVIKKARNHTENTMKKSNRMTVEKEEIQECRLEHKYPCKDYLRFLKWKKETLENQTYTFPEIEIIDIRTKESYKNMIVSLTETISKIESDIHYYEIMDYIYAGKEELVQPLCDKRTYQICLSLLQNPNERTREIYGSFASQNNIVCKNANLIYYKNEAE